MWARVARRSAVLSWVVVALAAASASAARVLPAAGGCTTSSASPPPGAGHGLAPNQLAAAYGFSNLWAAGDQGAGTRVALLEVGQGLDPGIWSKFAACYAPGDEPVQVQASGGPPGKLGDEGILDPMAVAAAAPEAQIYMFESGPVGGEPQKIPAVLATLLKAALNPANTGGKEVNAISTSEITCEAAWSSSELKAMQTQLRRAASLGVQVFAAAGDAGSVGSYLSAGTRTCIGWPVDESTPRSDWPGLQTAVDYPGSSPSVTSVGGTELVINGVTPAPGSGDYKGDPAGGTITDEIVWNQQDPGMAGSYFGGGGGLSDLFNVKQAPWERDVGLSGREAKPDISALAGSPFYLQYYYGTSAASPLMAGAFADLDEYLAGEHAKPIGPANPTLYHVASKPKLYPQVFNDVVDGSNDLLGLGCCQAGPGYDAASGLGSLNVWRLAGTLLAHPKLLVPWTRLKLSASSSTDLSYETITASTSNVIRGTPYFINIYIHGKLVRRCKRDSCHAKIHPRKGEVEADVGPRHAKPFRKQAIVSKKVKVTVHIVRPGCHGSTCM